VGATSPACSLRCSSHKMAVVGGRVVVIAGEMERHDHPVPLRRTDDPFPHHIPLQNRLLCCPATLLPAACQWRTFERGMDTSRLGTGIYRLAMENAGAPAGNLPAGNLPAVLRVPRTEPPHAKTGASTGPPHPPRPCSCSGCYGGYEGRRGPGWGRGGRGRGPW